MYVVAKPVNTSFTLGGVRSGRYFELYFPLTCTLAHVWGFRHVQPVYVGDKLSLADNRKSRARELDDPDPLYVAVEQIETHIYGYKSNLAETKVRSIFLKTHQILLLGSQVASPFKCSAQLM
jgi:hypothetical protein